ncbi:MAG: transposase [Pseudomonadota bacterium]
MTRVLHHPNPYPRMVLGRLTFFEVAVAEPDLPDTTSKGASLTVDALCATRVDITLSDGRRLLFEGSTSLIAVVGLFQG